MTDTVGTPAGTMGEAAGSWRATQLKRALRIERVYSTEHCHPYEQVTWQRRDVVMTNWRDGTVNFEQRGVEFPDFWSVNAVNIVTYFIPPNTTTLRKDEPQPLTCAIP